MRMEGVVTPTKTGRAKFQDSRIPNSISRDMLTDMPSAPPSPQLHHPPPRERSHKRHNMLFTSVPYWGHTNEQKIRELLWLKLGWCAAQIWPVHLWPPHPRDLKGSKPLPIQSSSLMFLIDEVEKLSLKDAGPCPGLHSPLVSGHGHFDSQATANDKPPNSITKTLGYPWNPVVWISQS